jgi:hypothetical protein
MVLLLLATMMSSTATETVMRTTRVALLTGAAAIVLGGLAGMAEAKVPETHVLTLRLPDGQVEQVRYVGDLPPTVVVAPAAISTSSDPLDPFAMLEQVATEMDRQAEVLFRNIDALSTSDGGSFGMIPVLSGPAVCTRSVQITYAGDDQAPRVVSRTSGDCGPARERAAPVALPNAPASKPAPDSDHEPGLVEVKAAKPYQGLVHRAVDWQR